MAVPKKKISRGVTKRRHKAWVKQNVTRIKNFLNLVTDKATGNVRLNHHVDPVTGQYNGKQILDKGGSAGKVTKIKA